MFTLHLCARLIYVMVTGDKLYLLCCTHVQCKDGASDCVGLLGSEWYHQHVRHFQQPLLIHRHSSNNKKSAGGAREKTFFFLLPLPPKGVDLGGAQVSCCLSAKQPSAMPENRSEESDAGRERTFLATALLKIET